MTRINLPAAVACYLVGLCSLQRSSASNDTSVAAALKALAYVPEAHAANVEDASNARASVFATQPSPAAPPNSTLAYYSVLLVNKDLISAQGVKHCRSFNVIATLYGT